MFHSLNVGVFVYNNRIIFVRLLDYDILVFTENCSSCEFFLRFCCGFFLYCLNEDYSVSIVFELAALTSLSKNKDIVIQKSDKRSSVVTTDKGTYIKRMENLLNDHRKFEKSYFKK